MAPFARASAAMIRLSWVAVTVSIEVMLPATNFEMFEETAAMLVDVTVPLATVNEPVVATFEASEAT